MRRDKGFWLVIGLYVFTSIVLSIAAWRFTSDIPFGYERFADAITRQTEVPEETRKFAGMMADMKTEWAKRQTNEYVGGIAGGLLLTSLVAFVFLAARQDKLKTRLEQLEADRRAD